MLSYERILYEDAKASCCFKDVDAVIAANKGRLECYSEERGVPLVDVERQVRLHAPSLVAIGALSPDSFWRFAERFLNQIFSESRIAQRESFLEACGDRLLMGGRYRMERHGGKVYIVPGGARCRHAPISEGECLPASTGNSAYRAHLAQVNDADARLIEGDLHYLRAARSSHVASVGLFIDGCSMPICYMGYCAVDRQDKLAALEKALGRSINPSEVVELARVYGCGHLPKCSISLLDSYASRLFLAKYRYVITAVNIALGFTGDSVRASGYIPYALRPVSYWFDERGLFCTKRKAERLEGTLPSTSEAPPNILYAKELRSPGGSVTNCRIVSIACGFEYLEPDLYDLIRSMRADLESAWNDDTRYHGTVIKGKDKPSKGQCGVSSLLLANVLRRNGHDALFCEGDAYFPREKDGVDVSIAGHCWVKIARYRGREYDVIIDMTADQNGSARRVILNTADELERLGIKYVESHSNPPKKPDEVNVGHLLGRLAVLEERLKARGSEYE